MSTLKTCVEKKPRPQKNFRVTDDELKTMQASADKYCKGNLSEWIRYAALNFVPSAADLVK